MLETSGVAYSATLQISKSQLSSHFLGLSAALDTVGLALVFEALYSLELHDILLLGFFFLVFLRVIFSLLLYRLFLLYPFSSELCLGLSSYICLSSPF